MARKKAQAASDGNIVVKLNVSCVSLPHRTVFTHGGTAVVSLEEFATLKEMGVVVE